jgi:hypothetical protein
MQAEQNDRLDLTYQTPLSKDDDPAASGKPFPTK